MIKGANKILLIISALLILFSCESQDRRTMKVSIDTIDDVRIEGNKVTFYFSGIIPTPCWELEKVEVEKSNKFFQVTVFAESKGDVVCPQVITTLNVQHKFILEEEGSYLFSFWQSDTSSLLYELRFLK